MKILGINLNHISTAALVVDGQLVSAAPEERFSRRKLSTEFPFAAIDFVLKGQNLTIYDVDAIAIAWNPSINLVSFKRGYSSTHRWMPEFLYLLPNNLMRMAKPTSHAYTHQEFVFDDKKKLNIYYVNHHMGHVAGAYYLSPYKNAALLSIDGFGEKSCVYMAKARGNEIEFLQEQSFPHSAGSFYETVTEFLGFTPDSDEWKVMGMAAYGEPSRFRSTFEKLIHFLPNGKFELELKYFKHYNFDQPGRFTDYFVDLFGAPRKNDEEELNQRHFDIAAGAQEMFEKILVHCCDHLHELTKETNLCVAGGTAMNCVANGKIPFSTAFKNLYIPYAPDDSGNSIGAALYVHHNIYKGERRVPEKASTSLLGPEWSNDSIKICLDKYGIAYEESSHLIADVVDEIVKGRVVGWFQGKMEFGQRALGCRSILADPRRVDMKDVINSKIKYRESFRPFAPAVLKEHAHEYFDIPSGDAVDHMEKVYFVKKEKRGVIPAATHNDGTGRLQTVDRSLNPKFHDLIRAFGDKTGVPVLINTSFNIKGEPIVCSPEDAIKTFYTSGIDILAIGNCIIRKKC